MTLTPIRAVSGAIILAAAVTVACTLDGKHCIGDCDALGVTTGPTTGSLPTTGSSSTGAPLEPLPAACEKLCDAMIECGMPQPPECAEQCSSREAPGSECAGTLADLWNCVAALPCVDLTTQLQAEPKFCLDEVATYDDECAIPDCTPRLNGDTVSCFIRRPCMDHEQRLQCDGDICTCFEDQVVTGTCPNADFCAALPGSIKSSDAEACCGWDWP